MGGLPCVTASRWPIYMALQTMDLEGIARDYGFDERKKKELEIFAGKIVSLFENRFR